MIYMTGENIKIIILESGNLEELRKGLPATTPDKAVLIAWTPDPVWLSDKLADCDGDGETIAKLIGEAATRPEKPTPRPYHPLHETHFKRKEFGQ
jgi:hypothetical protein